MNVSSPNFLCVKKISNAFSDFLLSSKLPKCRKEILEGEICHGGCKLHNTVLFYLIKPENLVD